MNCYFSDFHVFFFSQENNNLFKLFSLLGISYYAKGVCVAK